MTLATGKHGEISDLITHSFRDEINRWDSVRIPDISVVPLIQTRLTDPS